MNELRMKLEELVVDGSIASFDLQEQLPTMGSDTESRLIDRLTLVFHDGNKINLETLCSGCMENTCLCLFRG